MTGLQFRAPNVRRKRGRDGRPPKRKGERLWQIGQFSKTENGFTGLINTLAIKAQDNRVAQLPPISGDEPESRWSGPEDCPGAPRHTNSRSTLDIYRRAISATKREANNKVMEMVIEAGKSKLSAPSQRERSLAIAVAVGIVLLLRANWLRKER
jgi:hypothetical protein